MKNFIFPEFGRILKIIIVLDPVSGMWPVTPRYLTQHLHQIIIHNVLPQLLAYMDFVLLHPTLHILIIHHPNQLIAYHGLCMVVKMVQPLTYDHQ